MGSVISLWLHLTGSTGGNKFPRRWEREQAALKNAGTTGLSVPGPYQGVEAVLGTGTLKNAQGEAPASC